MRYSKGIMWLDDCRIPFVDEGDMKATTEKKFTIGEGKQSEMGFGTKKIGNVSTPKGRFTPSLLVCDDMLNDGTITLSQGGNSTNIGGFITAYADESKRGVKSGYSDTGSSSRYYDLDKWFNKLIDNL